MSVTVIIPTYKRPEYLQTVLESVRWQTAAHEIDLVIVSENSDDTRSRAVCEQFTGLPLRFVQQPVALASIDHGCWLIGQSESDYTAMIHDDDWWYPTHLECALKALKNENTAAYCSNFIFSKNEIGKDAIFHHAGMVSCVAATISVFEPVLLSFEDICTLCYVYTPFHMSSLVAKTPFYKIASEKGLKVARPWYADRILYPYLAMYGKLAFNPQVLTGVREHASNDAKAYGQDERYTAHAEGASKIAELAKSKGFDILKRWETIRSAMPGSAFDSVFAVFNLYFGPGKEVLFVTKPAVASENPRPVSLRILRNLLPHGLVRYLKL